MSENIGFILGALFFLILIFGGAFLEFLERRRADRFRHEREMAKIRARAVDDKKDDDDE